MSILNAKIISTLDTFTCIVKHEKYICMQSTNDIHLQHYDELNLDIKFNILCTSFANKTPRVKLHVEQTLFQHSIFCN